MSDISIITESFPGLSPEVISKIEHFKEIFTDWNAKINLVSRKDIDNFYQNHVLHSLCIAKFTDFPDGIKILDIGTGGGFPGIPLAIFFPKVHFTLVDSIRKKMDAVRSMAEALGLDNVTVINSRAEALDIKVDFVVSRATAPLSDLVAWSKGKFLPKSLAAIPNGIICLKGGDLTEELLPYKKKVFTEPVTSYIKDSFFEEKKIVYLPMV